MGWLTHGLAYNIFLFNEILTQMGQDGQSEASSARQAEEEYEEDTRPPTTARVALAARPATTREGFHFSSPSSPPIQGKKPHKHVRKGQKKKHETHHPMVPWYWWRCYGP